jgi:hypothetical protein
MVTCSTLMVNGSLEVFHPNDAFKTRIELCEGLKARLDCNGKVRGFESSL